MVRARADVGADFVEDGCALQEQSFMRPHLMEFMQLGKEVKAKFGNMLAVAWIGVIAFGKDVSSAQDFLLKGADECFGNEEVVKQTLLVVRDGNVDLGKA